MSFTLTHWLPLFAGRACALALGDCLRANLPPCVLALAALRLAALHLAALHLAALPLAALDVGDDFAFAFALELAL